MKTRTTSYSKHQNSTKKPINNNIVQPKERKFLDLPKDRAGWSSGEWSGFFATLNKKTKS